MKHNRFIFTLSFLVCLGLSGLKAQNMYVRPTNGTQTDYAIANIRKLTFSEDTLFVTPVSGSVTSHSLSSNRYINFTNLTLATVTPQKASTAIYVYPNPVVDVLHVSVEEQEQSEGVLEIIALEGRLILKQKLDKRGKTQIQASMLPQGMYLCKITHGSQTQTIKFFKQ